MKIGYNREYPCCRPDTVVGEQFDLDRRRTRSVRPFDGGRVVIYKEGEVAGEVHVGQDPFVELGSLFGAVDQVWPKQTCREAVQAGALQGRAKIVRLLAGGHCQAVTGGVESGQRFPHAGKKRLTPGERLMLRGDRQPPRVGRDGQPHAAEQPFYGVRTDRLQPGAIARQRLPSEAGQIVLLQRLKHSDGAARPGFLLATILRRQDRADRPRVLRIELELVAECVVEVKKDQGRLIFRLFRLLL